MSVQSALSARPEPASTAAAALRVALSRFEFETGRANDGTKILMVEWGGGPEWADVDVAWDGKTDTNVLPVAEMDETDEEAGQAEGGPRRRLYFLLPPGLHVPPLVSIRHRAVADDKSRDVADEDILWTKPMPAIYSASTTSTAAAGRRGVLHTIWARRRLAAIEAEIAAEMQANSESIGLQIALREQAWIAEHFGVVGGNSDATITTATTTPPPTAKTTTTTTTTTTTNATSPPTTSPTTPTASKLSEKLRGLRLATSPTQLAAAPRGFPAVHVHTSLDAVMQGSQTVFTPGAAADVDEDELFALPLSPRSPDEIKSPFSMRPERGETFVRIDTNQACQAGKDAAPVETDARDQTDVAV